MLYRLICVSPSHSRSDQHECLCLRAAQTCSTGFWCQNNERVQRSSTQHSCTVTFRARTGGYRCGSCKMGEKCVSLGCEYCVTCMTGMVWANHLIVKHCQGRSIKFFIGRTVREHRITVIQQDLGFYDTVRFSLTVPDRYLSPSALLLLVAMTWWLIFLTHTTEIWHLLGVLCMFCPEKQWI